MLTPQILPWCAPLDLAAAVEQEYFVLLYSGVRTNYSGRYSYLAVDMDKKITAADFSEFEQALSHDKTTFDNAWFGYLGYGLKNSLETLHSDEKNWLNLPDLLMMRFASIYQFDHEEKTLTLWSKLAAAYNPTPLPEHYTSPKVSALTSNMTRAEYLQKAAYVIDRIHAGDLYQANLTRKYSGRFAAAPAPLQLFKKLCAVSPAPFSAFMRLGEHYILSSSPESFLNIDAQGNVTTRPIKGTAPRGADPIADKKLREELVQSEKDRAENLMIVDLMRNDLAKSCEAGSIKTEKLFEVTTHATIHHLSSTITGCKKKNSTNIEVIKNAFPPGSMTGAPKIHAMNLCSKLEKQERGVYSGAIGWFGGDSSCDLSVVIRTLFIWGDRFEFQVGGGIVADSLPERELEELIDKSKGIRETLGLSRADISAI